MTSYSSIARTLLKAILEKKTQAFSGIGLVFYSNLQMTSHIEMGHMAAFRPPLPILGIDKISSVLADAADSNSPWHDGFHFIESTSLMLTHLSHFISPPLELFKSVPLNKRPSGARHITAMITSAIAGIDCVGLLSSDNELTIFENGLPIIMEKTL
jgi:hypothetical protein